MMEAAATSSSETLTGLFKTIELDQIGAAVSKLVSGAIGDIVMVMSKSAEHKMRTLADIEWLVLPAVFSGQYYVAEAVQQGSSFRAPVACLTWASVSAEVAGRLSRSDIADLRPDPHEWTCGPQIWLIDAVGDQPALAVALQALSETHFKDKDVFVRVRLPDGTSRVETMAVLSAAANKGPVQ
jgi:hemolysin-activating ACP:hemolysin acyltransferase